MSEYFDLHTQGLGYLNRIREVKPKNGQSFWACDIAALHGATDNVNYTRFDCRVSGSNAIELVQQYQASVEDRKVLIGFRLGDLYADTFIYSKGERAGETGVSLKARLLYIGWIKVDGQLVYRADTESEHGEAPEPHNRDFDTNAELEQPTTTAMPVLVQLSKTDPDFEARKRKLKQSGYCFDGQAKVWRLPQAF